MTAFALSGVQFAKVSSRSTLLAGGAFVANSGNGSISGVVKEDGVPVSRRVMLYERHSGRLVNTTYSKKNGKYNFSNINKSLKYYIVSIDEFSDGIDCPAVIQDRVSGGYDEEALS